MSAGCRKFPAARAAVWLAAWLIVLPAAGAPAAGWQRTTLGLCEDYPEETRTLAHARADLMTAKAAGAQVLRIAFGWDSIESARGHYDWRFWDEFVRMAVDDCGLRLIPYVCYTPKWAASDAGDNYWRSPPRDPADFGRFMTAIVGHYRDRVHSWELWNEPDNQDYWLGTPAQYAALVRAGSAAVRRADPSARVVLGGISGQVGFLAGLLRQQHLGEEVDVINCHSYFETWHPSPIEHLAGYIGSIARLIHSTGGRQALWMAETGYSSVGDRADISSSYRTHFRGEHTEAAQAGALARTLLTTLATNEVALWAWYRINDLPPRQDVIGDDNNRVLGLRRVDGSPKPALATFTYLAHLFAEPYEVVAPAVTVAASTVGRPEVRMFVLRDGRRVVAAWLAMPDEPADPAPASDPRAAVLRIIVPGAWPHVAVRDATGAAVSPADARWRAVGGNVVLDWHFHGGAVWVAELAP